MSYSTLRLDIDDGIARLTLADPARGNPIDGAMCRDLRCASEDILESDGVRVVLMKAEGPVFSYGGDITAFMAHFDNLPETITKWVTDLNMAIGNLQKLDAPVVAVVHGVCAGGMVGIVAGADIVLSSETAKFVAAYAGIGACCDGGSSSTVGRRIGFAKARSFFLLDQTVSASEALDIGLVDEMLGEATIATRADEIVAKLARGPTKAFGEMKRLLASAQNHSFEEQIQLKVHALIRCMSGAEGREGLLAFSERRCPDFPAIKR